MVRHLLLFVVLTVGCGLYEKPTTSPKFKNGDRITARLFGNHIEANVVRIEWKNRWVYFVREDGRTYKNDIAYEENEIRLK